MDWKLLLAEIRAAGLSQIQIAKRLGRSQAWVSAAMGGKYLDLKWAEGQAIIALHAEVTTSPRPDDIYPNPTDGLPSRQEAA